MIVTGREKFEKYKSILFLIIKCFGVFGAKGNYFFLKAFRNTNGIVGITLRYIFLKNCARSLGDNVSLHPGVFLFNTHNLIIGDNVSIHPMCYLDAAGNISIGDNVSIAHNCSILSTNHQWNEIDVPIKYNKESFANVTIEDDVWLGCGVRVLAGVVISKRSIVAAGAVVNKNIESNSIYGGIPAKKIKDI